MTPVFNFFLHQSRFINKFNSPIIRNMSKKALVLLAPGAEEIEFVVSADVLVRGGIEVTVAGVPCKDLVKCSRGVNIQPDVSIAEATKCDYDAIILPGGLGGSKTLASSAEVGQLLKNQESKGKIIAAICAAPTALKAHGVGLGKTITSYPSFKGELETSYKYVEDRVVVDGNYVTSRGPATAFDFALKLVEILAGKEKANEVSKTMLLSC